MSTFTCKFCILVICEQDNFSLYILFCRKMISEFGIWDQIRIYCGREWKLNVVYPRISQHRNDPSKPPHLQSSSTLVCHSCCCCCSTQLLYLVYFYVAFFQNHVVEKMWVEVNTSINYPIKETLITMMEQGQISLDDELCKYCVSWYTLCVANVGVGLFLAA